MTSADYQLRYQIYGQQGSLWERQVTDGARVQIRKIVQEAGNAGALTEIDHAVTSLSRGSRALVEDEFFRFSDGDFAVIGPDLNRYEHSEVTLSDGTRLHIAYRPDTSSRSSKAYLTRLSTLTDDFVDSINSESVSFDTTRNWYLVPVPSNITPLVVEGAGEDVHLVNGIDFISRTGYIAMTDNPADVLPSGMVKVTSCYKSTAAPNSFVLAAPDDRKSSKYLAEYSYKSQSLLAFKRAAAEYAGLYVFEDADAVLSATQVSDTSWIYNMASAGAVAITYPHTPLTAGQTVEPGYIISAGFEIVSSPRAGSAALSEAFYDAAWGVPVSLDGVLPVIGLSWDGFSAVEVESVESDPTTGKPHLRLVVDGEMEILERWWDIQKDTESRSGTFLFDELGSPALPTTVDLWELLESFYGSQLVLVMVADHTPKINVRLERFLRESHPSSCVLLLSTQADVPDGAVRDINGIPILDSDGNYVGGDSDTGGGDSTGGGEVVTENTCGVYYGSGDDVIIFDGGELYYGDCVSSPTVTDGSTLYYGDYTLSYGDFGLAYEED